MTRVALLLALVACSKSKPAEVVVRGSCQSSPAVCEDYESTDAKYIKRQLDACTGSWKPTACPAANKAGSCKEARGWIRTRHYYRGAEGEDNPAVAEAKAQCAAYGTWSP